MNRSTNRLWPLFFLFALLTALPTWAQQPTGAANGDQTLATGEPQDLASSDDSSGTEALLDPCEIILQATDIATRAPCCGDGICEFGEQCTLDCSSCGDLTCNGFETCSTCPGDCGSCPYCGDGICAGSETCTGCPDCPSCFSYPFYSFYRGVNSRRIFKGFSHDGIAWQGDHELNTNAESIRGPVAVMFDGKIFVFHRGEGNSEIYFSYSSDGETWYGNRQLRNGAQTDEAPGAAVFNGRIYVVHKGRSNGTIWISSSTNGFTWETNAPIIPLDNGTSEAPSLATFNGKLYLVFQNRISKKITVYTSTNGSSWQFLTSSFAKSNHGVGLTVFENKLWVAYADTYGELYAMSLNTLNQWSVPSRLGTGYTNERPSLATDGAKMVALYKNATDTRNFYAYTFNGLTWSDGSPAVGLTIDGGPFILSTD